MSNPIRGGVLLDKKGNSKAKAALPKARLVSIAGPRHPGWAHHEALPFAAPNQPGRLPIFPYLSRLYRDFVGCYLKCYQQASKIHKPYVRTIEASATRTMDSRTAR
jgi:hypothetical protein